MLSNFAAGTLIVLGAVITILGFLLGGGNLTFMLIGLGAIAVGGVIGLLDRRRGA